MVCIDLSRNQLIHQFTQNTTSHNKAHICQILFNVLQKKPFLSHDKKQNFCSLERHI